MAPLLDHVLLSLPTQPPAVAERNLAFAQVSPGVGTLRPDVNTLRRAPHSSGVPVSNDAIVILRADHKEVRALFREFESSGTT